MAGLKLKPGAENFEAGFNGSFGPIGKRDDLHLLAADAKSSNHKTILDLFEDTSDETIKAAQLEYFNKTQSKKEVAANTAVKTKP